MPGGDAGGKGDGGEDGETERGEAQVQARFPASVEFAEGVPPVKVD